MGDVNAVLGPLPEGYIAVPLFPDQGNAPLRLSVVLRKAADPVSGRLVILRDHRDARVLLGAVKDAAGTLHQYIEIHVQVIGSIRDAGGERYGLTNKSLDDRWIGDYQAATAADGASVISAGFESRHPSPLLL